LNEKQYQAYSEYTSMYWLTFRVRRYAVMCTARRYVVIATKPRTDCKSAQ